MTETKQRSRLEAGTVWNHVDHVLNQVNPSLNQKLGITLRPITNWDKTGVNKMDAPLYFAIEILNLNDNQTKVQDISFLAFSVGYSTWEGLCIFVDELGPMDTSQERPHDQLYLQILAKIAVRLGSSRLTWKRCYPPVPSWYQSNPSVGPPDILDELHIFHMDQAAMEAYADYLVPSTSSSTKISLDRSSLEEQSRRAMMESSSSNNKFSIRLAEANSLEDAQAMERLVKGLAIYVKEPLEDIHCDANDYLIDGSGNHPLYYTFLLETTSTSDITKNDTTDATKQVCGIAVVYFGHSNKSGRYLYLEDLYVDQAYQHQGAGSLTLRMLTILALKLQCESFQWLALDWNAPALDLYQNKMGAKIQEGKKVTRYTDSKLKEFADGFSSTLAGM